MLLEWINMIDFYNNTYFVRRTEKDVVIKILKKHPEYRGFRGGFIFHDCGLNQYEYDYLWETVDSIFSDYSDESAGDTIYLDNEYITQSQAQHNPWLVGLAEVYTNEDCVQHDPQPLLPILKKIDNPSIRMD